MKAPADLPDEKIMDDRQERGRGFSSNSDYNVSGTSDAFGHADTSRSTRMSRNTPQTDRCNGVRKTGINYTHYVELARTLPAFTEQLMPLTVTDFTSTYL